MKKFELLSTQPLKGKINIPVLNAMTNGEVADRIEHAINARHISLNGFKRREVDNYLRLLRNEPEELYIDPSGSEDCFVLAFGFKSYAKDAAIFAAVLLFAGFAESVFDLIS